MSEAQSIFFDTLEQYTNDSSAGASIVAAVAATLTDAPELRAAANDEAAVNLRWFATRDEQGRTQIMALAAAVNKFLVNTEGRAKQKENPAKARLEYLELAAAIYRHLQKKKTAVSHVVAQTTIRTKAAFFAIVRSNLPLVNQMRQVKRTRNWTTISATLETITGTKIPPNILSKIHGEVMAETEAKTANPTAPLVMTHWENERVSDETKAAYEKAGFEGIETKECG